MMEQLKRELRKRYKSTYKESVKIGYTPSLFLRMISSTDDIVDVTRRLIHNDTLGFAKLNELGRLDLSVEKIILEPKYKVLFIQEDLQVAEDRLEKHGYNKLGEIEMSKQR